MDYAIQNKKIADHEKETIVAAPYDNFHVLFAAFVSCIGMEKYACKLPFILMKH